jgi:predicted DNA binding protein
MAKETLFTRAIGCISHDCAFTDVPEGYPDIKIEGLPIPSTITKRRYIAMCAAIGDYSEITKFLNNFDKHPTIVGKPRKLQIRTVLDETGELIPCLIFTVGIRRTKADDSISAIMASAKSTIYEQPGKMQDGREWFYLLSSDRDELKNVLNKLRICATKGFHKIEVTPHISFSDIGNIEDPTRYLSRVGTNLEFNPKILSSLVGIKEKDIKIYEKALEEGLYELPRRGVTQEELAKKLNTSRDTIMKALRRAEAAFTPVGYQIYRLLYFDKAKSSKVYRQLQKENYKKWLEKLDEDLIFGKISEETYLELRSKYESKIRSLDL